MPGGEIPTDDELTAVVDDCDELAYRDWSDRALAAAVVLRRGDACAEIYRRHSGSVTATARMILGNRPACEDVAAEVFAGFWLSPKKFDPDRGSLLGFLRLSARGRSIDLLRSERSRRRREEGDVVWERLQEPEIDSAMVATDVAGALRRAVASLPLTEREAIHLAFFIGMSYRAAAVRLNLPVGTVKSRIRSGLRRLRTTGDSLLLPDSDGFPSNGRTDTPVTNNASCHDLGRL